MSWLSDAVDAISGDGWGSIISTGINLAGGLMAPDASESMAYGNTKAGFDAQMAFEKDKLAQSLEIARMNAAAGGAGAGAALKAAQLQYDAAMKQLKEKYLADSLALQLQGQGQSAQAQQGAANTAVTAAQNLGETGRLGFQNAAQGLTAFRK